MEVKASTFSVIFRIRKSKLNQGLVPIYVRVTINGKRMEQSLNETINPEDWNHKAGMAKAKKEELKNAQ